MQRNIRVPILSATSWGGRNRETKRRQLPMKNNFLQKKR